MRLPARLRRFPERQGYDFSCTREEHSGLGRHISSHHALYGCAIRLAEHVQQSHSAFICSLLAASTQAGASM